MSTTITARPTYTRRPVPKQYDAGWLGVELGNVQRAFVPTKSRTTFANDRVQATDWIIYCDATNGAFTETLPPPDQVHDLVVVIKKIDATANVIAIAGVIDGVTNRTLSAQYDTVMIHSSGSAYYLLGAL